MTRADKRTPRTWCTLATGLPHDPHLEPDDSTIAEVQAMMCQSRQLTQPSYPRLLSCIEESTRMLAETSDPRFALAIAVYALRIREEHLV